MPAHRRPLFLLLFVALFAFPKPVRGQDVSGTWVAEVPVRVANHGGADHVEQTATVTITLAQDGEVIHGTWQMAALPDLPEPEVRPLHGVLRDGAVVLTDTVQAMVRRGNELPTPITMVNTIELRLEGDRLTGHQSARSTDGMINSQPRPITATRAQS
jgi:hypothetical protein